MKANYLFPHYCKWIGWSLFIPFCIAGILWLADTNVLPTIKFTCFGWEGPQKGFMDDFMDELLVIGNTVALLLITFSKEKHEDEYIAGLRLRSFVYSILINYVVVIIGTLYLYEMRYLVFLCINMFTILLLFFVIFNILLYKFKHVADD